MSKKAKCSHCGREINVQRDGTLAPHRKQAEGKDKSQCVGGQINKTWDSAVAWLSERYYKVKAERDEAQELLAVAESELEDLKNQIRLKGKALDQQNKFMDIAHERIEELEGKLKEAQEEKESDEKEDAEDKEGKEDE